MPFCPQILCTYACNTKVTTIQGDAADESLVAATCKRAVDEEGRLDVFFANVSE